MTLSMTLLVKASMVTMVKPRLILATPMTMTPMTNGTINIGGRQIRMNMMVMEKRQMKPFFAFKKSRMRSRSRTMS